MENNSPKSHRDDAEEKYKALFESSSDAIMTLAPPAWKFTDGNPATIKMFRVKDNAEFESLGPWELSPEYQPDGKRSDEKALQMIHKAMERGSHFFEWTHKRYKGENFPATVLLTRMHVGGKELLQATVRDITKQKRIEQLLESQYTMVKVFNESPKMTNCIPKILKILCDAMQMDLALMWLLDPSENVLQYVDSWQSTPKQFQEFMKASRGLCFPKGIGLAGRIWEKQDAIWISDIMTEQSDTRAAIAEKNGLHGAYGFPIMIANKLLGVIEIFGRKVTSPDKYLINTLTACGKQIAQFLQRSEAEFQVEQTLATLDSTLQSTLNATADGILIVDREGRMTHFNQKFLEMWKIPADIAESRDDAKALAFVLGQLKEPELFLRKVKELYGQDDAQSFDILEFKDGRFFERYSLPQKLERKYIGRVWSFRDITERKQLDRLKDEFLGTVSHELRTPLSIIKVALDNLNDNAIRTEQGQAEAIQMITRNTNRLSRMIDNLLDISRLESGRVKIKLQSIKLNPLIQEVIHNLDVEAQEKHIHFKIKLPEVLPSATADPDMLEQVMYNLLDNALRFAKEQVEICAQCNDSAIEVTVTDDGPGIPTEEISTLFNKFIQVRRPIGGSGYKGTGLGLAICKQILQVHNGKIWVESSPGSGARFHFTLPVRL